jgi:glycosyltransferase involved in cell wall biosynthesis
VTPTGDVRPVPVAVCHVSTAHPADDSRIFWRECVGLAKNGYSVTLVARADEDEVREGVQIRALKTYRRRSVRMTLGVARALRLALRTKASIFHLHDPELITILVVLRLMGKKVIYDAHEVLSVQVIQKDYIPRPLRRPVRWVARTLERYVGVVASGIVTVSPAGASVFPPARVTLVANYPDPHGLFDLPEARPGESADDGPPYFAYVGGITTPRGAAQLVDAIELVNETEPAQLKLAGWFNPEELEQSLSRRPGWPHVDYLGRVPHDQVARLLSASTAGLATLLPTPHHLVAPPVKSFEYIAMGIPMILSDFPYWRRTFDGVDCAIFVDPTDPAAIAAAMRDLIRDPERAAEMGRNGRRAVEERFNWSTQLDALVRSYRRLSGEQVVAA